MMIYIAGPLTERDGYTVQQNARQAIEVYLRLIEIGIHAFCPHLAALEPRAFDVHYEKWLAHDFWWIRRCTHVLLLPRWETSPGACREKAYAESLGKIVTTDLNSVIVDAQCRQATKTS